MGEIVQHTCMLMGMAQENRDKGKEEPKEPREDGLQTGVEEAASGKDRQNRYSLKGFPGSITTLMSPLHMNLRLGESREKWSSLATSTFLCHV